MKLLLHPDLPSLDPSIAVLCLLQQESGEATWSALNTGQAYQPAWEEKGSQTLLAGNRPLLLLGLGAQPGLEDLRRAVHTGCQQARTWGISRLALWMGEPTDEQAAAISEAALLSDYQFLTYKSKPKPNKLEELLLVGFPESAVATGRFFATSTAIARDLVNEPSNTLTATHLAREAQRLGKEFGFSVEVLEKTAIQALKMGGLLSVNLGSVEPPTFSILEYKPEKPVNSKPLVLVGKGVVYDTGGLSLKPTTNSMDYMKCDMAGAAAVIGTFCGAAAMALDVHLIGLIPATDNRPGENAYAPGDVLTMFDGTRVEMLNADAEGRIILADALAFAKKYDPALVIDLATLTGSAAMTLGSHGICFMTTAGAPWVEALREAGKHAHERIVELPLWSEYGDMIKSDIADIKNVGPSQAGAITAGKFLEHFTGYPWMHLDIAGSAFLHAADSYRGSGGTGAGVRLLLRFLSREGKDLMA